MCDYDEPSVCNTRVRTARKQHKCCECRWVIEPGDKYEYTSGVWDGEGMSFKTCLSCVEWKDALMAHRREEIHAENKRFGYSLGGHACYPVFGGLVEEIENDFGMPAW